jgi:hypothetical protein
MVAAWTVLLGDDTDSGSGTHTDGMHQRHAGSGFSSRLNSPSTTEANAELVGDADERVEGVEGVEEDDEGNAFAAAVSAVAATASSGPRRPRPASAVVIYSANCE